MREKILRKLAEYNTLMAPEAWEYLESMDNPYSVVEEMVETENELPFPIGRDTLSSYVDNGHEKKDLTEELEERIKILNDISGNSTCTGDLDDFTSYFRSRYEKLRKIVSKRRESKGIKNVAAVKKRKGEAKIIAMVGDIHNTSNGNKILSLEDMTGTIRGFISKDSEAYSKNLLEDEVILAIGEVWEKRSGYDETFSINDIIRPGVPKIRDKPDNDFEGKIAFIGDVHVGSDTFLREEWDRFVRWLNSDDQSANEIRYIVIMGDLIEGIGIYPNQEKELEIKDIYKQYEKLAQMLKKVPDDISIITIPGNHDIVRNPEPQPCLPEDIQKLFPPNVIFYGNPAFMDIEGLKILLYHGRSINDLSDLLPQVDTDYPITAMKEMLERRHLVPVYGKKTPIAPEKEDHLIIEELPDIFVTGHIHRTQVEDYSGIVLMNSSTWQSQTEYQKMRDIQPDPAKVIIFEPQTRQVTVQSFES